MKPHEYTAKIMDLGFQLGSGTYPKAPRIDDTAEFIGDPVTYQLDYEVDDFGSDYDDPTVRVVRIRIDFGGRQEVTLGFQHFRPEMQQEFDRYAREHCAEQERLREMDAKDFPRGER